MQTKVKVTANPVTNSVFTLNTNEDGTPKLGKDGNRYGFIRVEQKVVDLTEALARVSVRSAIKSIAEKSFEAAKDVLTPGMELTGKIIRKESLTKELGYNEKRAGNAENAPLCTVAGKPIYQTSEYTEDANAMDVLIDHDNLNEIKAFQAAEKASHAINS